jgi:hypothetical protein
VVTSVEPLVAAFEISDQAVETCTEKAIADAVRAVRAAAADSGITPDEIRIEVSDHGRYVVAHTPDGRSFAARVFTVPQPDRWSVQRRPAPEIAPARRARKVWNALPAKTRAAIIRDARQGTAWTDREEARAAMGWAWAVLGPPHTRTAGGRVSQTWYVLSALLAGPGGNMTSGNVFADSAVHDTNPVVIRAARQVERANTSVALET